MNKNVYRREDFIKILNISETELEGWEKIGCIRHLGKVDDEIPLYTDTNLEEARRIQELLKIGYDIESIQKIIRKVGLPKPDKNTKGDDKIIEYLTVGELASQTDLNPRTLKYWEERGIIQPDGRSTGGFRLYSKVYIYLCNLIKDLQNFGYSLEEIKEISDLFRDFISISQGTAQFSKQEAQKRLKMMQEKIASLNNRMINLKTGIQRWEDLLKKKKKEISQIIDKTTEQAKSKTQTQSKKDSTKNQKGKK